MRNKFISIDQNSHSLWDTVPKLHALTAAGWRGRHFVEDVDVAFTRRGATPDQIGDESLELAPESYYRDGASDWGAALFYTRFLGRNPLYLRELEPLLGITVKAAAKKLDISVDALYQRYSVSDNWQLIGSSYLFDRNCHRVIGDLQTAQIAPFLREILALARRDLKQAFPDRQAAARIDRWFDRETGLVQELLAQHGETTLPRFYQAWLHHHLGSSCQYSLTSELFAADPRQTSKNPLLAPFLENYEAMAEAYNRAIRETGELLHPLDLTLGELPYFAVGRRQRRMFRANLFCRNRKLFYADREWPLDPAGQPPLARMAQDGLLAIVGKAMVMVVEARRRDGGAPLALPEHGSLYMTAAHAWQRQLRKLKLPMADTFPVLRVKMHFLQRLREIRNQPFTPPEYLRKRLNSATLEVAEFAQSLPELRGQAECELTACRDPAGRSRLLKELDPELDTEIDRLEDERRRLARQAETRPRASEIWETAKRLKQQQFRQFVERTVDNLHISRLDYWNSRGALLPWSVALGGEDFYRNLIARAEVESETDLTDH